MGLLACLTLVCGEVPLNPFTLVSVTIDNLKPRLDSGGVIIDAHDGTVQRFGDQGPFYMHAVQYGLCQEPPNYGCDQTADHCGFQPDHNITVYVTDDLSSGSWKFLGNALEVADRPPGTLFRPHAIFNPVTKLYVLYWNYVHPSGAYAGNAAATATTPAGPFTVQVDVMNTTRAGGGDYDVFVDDDGQCYILYSAGHVISIEKLTPDCLASTGETAQVIAANGTVYNEFPEYFVEAPTFFKRGSTYYAMYGHCCCYCYQGSGLFVYTSLAPMGPWKHQPGGPINIACENATDTEVPVLGWGAVPTPGQGCLYGGSTQVSVTRSQQNVVIQVPTTNNAILYLYTGDRWQQSPDGLKGHDPQFWAPLSFDASGNVLPLHWVDNFTMTVNVSGTTTAPVGL